MNQQRYKVMPNVARTVFLLTLLVAFEKSHAQDSLVAQTAGSPFLFLAQQSTAQGASILSLYETRYATRVGVEYERERGSLRRPQNPATEDAGAFHASGVQRTSTLIVYGAFRYSVQRDEGQQWRNTGHSADEQPFIWADTAKGTWDRNEFDAQVRMATDWKNRRVQAGIFLHYKGGVGDRRTTPKPLYRFHELTINPSVIYKTDRCSLAADLRFGQQSEDNEMGYYVTDSPLLYRLRGYGTFTRTSFVSGVRLLNATRLGGGLAYMRGFTAGKHQYAKISFEQATGAIEEGIGTTIPAGEWAKTEISGAIGMGHTHAGGRWQTFADFAYADLAGTDPVFQAVNYYLQLMTVAPTIRYERADRWYMQLSAEYTRRGQEDIVSVTRASVDQVDIRLSYCRRFHLSDNVLLFAIPGIGYRETLSSSLQILNPTEISNTLVRADFDVLSQSYLQPALVGGVDIRYRQSTLRFSLSAKHLRNNVFDRTAVDVAVNYLIF